VTKRSIHAVRHDSRPLAHPTLKALVAPALGDVKHTRHNAERRLPEQVAGRAG
jgi:hypothetical protein